MSGSPPTFVDVGSAVSLREEDLTYARRLMTAGGDVELHVRAGRFQIFDLIAPDAALSRAARRARHDWLAGVLA